MVSNTNSQKEAVIPVAGSLWGLLRPYAGFITLLVLFTISANALMLVIPKIISRAIDTFVRSGLLSHTVVLDFILIAVVVFVFTYLQGVVQTYAAERVARDLRTRLTAKISVQDYAYVERVTPAKLLTNLTSDVDAVKTFVSQAISSLISSVFLIIGASTLLLLINWKLGLAILGIIPFLGILFFVIFSKVKKLFKQSQEAIDWLNKVINESILGAALIRIVNSHENEYKKFVDANTEARDIGLKILRLFAGLIPAITFATSIATVIILALGGHFIIQGTLTLGEFSAFNSYLAILIFPILVIGFVSSLIAQANASYVRLTEVLNAPESTDTGVLKNPIQGNIAMRDVTVAFGEKIALKHVSFEIKAGTKTAIIGPTAAGKTQLLYVLTGLLTPQSGEVLYDSESVDKYNKQALHDQVGFVFQDSIMFNLTVRENIAFSNTVTDESLQKAIDTAELDDFIRALPEKLDTIVSERGTSLSGGQKQRIMLARALAHDPKVLLLDDFTARVDTNTEQKILSNISKNYPDITLISVTQKISSIETYNQIILLMEGEVLASGTHKHLLKVSPEYVQIYNSQQSLNHYELHA
ncbi:MAG: ABC transporter ATP-binding protein [Patescibacteria group bacterium]